MKENINSNDETIEQRVLRMQVETLAWVPVNATEENDRRVLLKVFDYIITGKNINTMLKTNGR